MNNNSVKTSFVLLEQHGKVLLVQEGSELAYGLWCLPGGHTNNEESLIQAAIREAREEVGYEVEIVKTLRIVNMIGKQYKGESTDLNKNVEVHVFEGRIIGGDMNPEDPQQLDIAWFNKDHAAKLPLRWPWLLDLFADNK